ncbi:hypothetical protein [Hyphomicrobium sulfonivorans]|uniref:hypothetical protein n=1 Tax=Hyphomicrobium sulfonivorans TaxID=121290 RepID=UPI0015705F4D|nr:hypothetical protein [Hyphomicrobium sulfonivorans]MBI1649990.1 hypothetical protein [Hyphomicrobium sulfonivorans]NSL72908.1 hypothetical protein [Hyphomicrobium sulfonivorans]
MRLKIHQLGELFGILLLLSSTAMQLFYLEPMKRQIEWRLAAFTAQQNAQVQLRESFTNQITLLQQMNAAPDVIAGTEARRDEIFAKYRNSDADISDYMLENERVEGYLEIVVIVLFGLGSLLAGLGRTFDMMAARKAAGE